MWLITDSKDCLGQYTELNFYKLIFLRNMVYRGQRGGLASKGAHLQPWCLKFHS